MIIDAVIDFVLGVLQWISQQLPIVNVDLSPLYGVGAWLGWLDSWLALSTWATVLSVIIAVEVGIWLISAVRWLYDRLPLT